MMDLGKKMQGIATEAPTQSNDKYYPSLYIDMKGKKKQSYEVGDEIMAVVKLKLKSESYRITDNGKEASCEFEVMGIDFDYESGEKESEEDGDND